MAKAKYYAMIRTLWQGDFFKPFAGPFATRAEAQQVADEHASNGVNDYGRQDLTAVRETMVMSATTMRREIGWNTERAAEHMYYLAQLRIQEERWRQNEKERSQND